MSKAAPPPLLGFNNNVRHRGRIFHIQTEDSGVKFPRIVTHLFADGGRIVKTTRTDYSEHVEKPDMAVVVRGMMKEQHKAMFAALRAGDMDSLLENVCGPLDAAKAKAPESVLDPTAKNDLDTARVIVGNAVSLPPQSTTDVQSVIRGVIEAEQSAIEHYRDIIHHAESNDDPVTADLAIQILGDEEEHLSLFEGFLAEIESRD